MDHEPKSRAAQRAGTRQRLLDAALEVFSARGFHGASVDVIARAAGFTKGAVYANFAGKEDLFLAVADRRLERQKADALAQHEAADDHEERRAAFDEEVRQEFADDAAWALMAYETVLYAVRESPRLRAEIAERFRHADEWATDYLREQGADRPDRIPALALAKSALGDGLMLRHLIDPEDVTAERVSQVYETVFDPPERRAWQA